MLTGIGIYQGGRSGGNARVYVRCEKIDQPMQVHLILDEHEWNDQLRNGSFEDWTNAALAGARHALDTVNQDTGSWVVHRIVGLLVDTIPKYVAIAAALSVWNALRIDITDALNNDLERFVSEYYLAD